MRQKLPCLLLTGALALSLAACAPGGEAPSPGPTPSQPVETDAPSRPLESAPPSAVLALPPESSSSPAAEYDLPERDYQPWQEAYMDFLAALVQADEDTRGKLTESGEYYWPAYEGLAVDERGVYCLDAGEPLRMTLTMALGSESFSLHDVDGDGVPELFVKYSCFEAAYTTQCYTFRDGQVVCIGEFSSGHSSLYTDPGKSAVVRHEAHMGYAELYEYPMEGGRLTEERVLFTEEDVREYTQTAEIVPGAEYIQTFYTHLGGVGSHSEERPHALAGTALLLPIADWQVGRAATGDSSETARTAILAALNGEGQLYGASGDHFYGDVGWTTWEAYIQPEAAYPYNDVPFAVQAYVWQDMNGDGQEECVLQLAAEDEGQNTLTVVLSEQDGAVYAYAFGFLELARDTIEVGYPYQAELYTDGALQSQYGEVTALSFWKDQCCQYAAQRDPSAQPVKWVDGSPAG